MKCIFTVAGLDCNEEVTALRGTVGRLPGVTALEFDLIQARMTVEHDPEQPPVEAIIRAAAAAGLKAQEFTGESCATGVCAVEPAQRGFDPRLPLTLLSAALMAVAFTVESFLAGGAVKALHEHYFIWQRGIHPAVPALYAASIVCALWLVAPKAWLSLKHLRPDMNLLMVTAITGAVLIGEWLEAASVALLFAVSLLLESWSVGRARRAIAALTGLSPTTARVQHADGSWVVQPAAQVQLGAIARVFPGEKIPLDGVVTGGATSVNQAPITGESVPVEKGVGDEVFAGTINNEGAFEFRVTRAARDTTLARIIHLVEEARSRKAPSEQWVERFARYYTPAMMAVALAFAVIPPLLFHGEWLRWIYFGLVVLVIACPCALVISTPVSIVAGLTSAARQGVLIKGGVYLEAPSQLAVVAFDKTGTLTYGRPVVKLIVPANDHTEEELLARAAALESFSEHPIAKAILAAAQERGVQPLPAESFRAVQGLGAEALVDGRPFWVGSHRYMEERGNETPELCAMASEFEALGHTVVAVGNDNHVCGLIAVSDTVRSESAEAVRGLRAAGVKRVAVLSGDHHGTVHAVAEEAGVDEFYANLLPQDKVALVQEMVAKYGRVGMVGDGINDAPALAAATVGIAMGAAGSDAAVETADIALMSDDLTRLPWLVRHSRRTVGMVKQNIAFSLASKLAVMLLALVGLATLWMAIAADIGVTLLVVFNSLRLLGGRAGIAPEPAAAESALTGATEEDRHCGCEEEAGMEKLNFRIEGMTCNHCAMAVEAALKAVKGVEKARVDLETAQAVVEGHRLDAGALAAAVASAGYRATLLGDA